MYDKSPHSAWRDRTLSAMMDPLWGEPDEKKRIAGWKMVDARIAQEGLVLPLLQYVEPIICRKGLKVTAQINDMVLPQRIDIV
jgi:peptide/nickel transport system substrate-binding protein